MHHERLITGVAAAFAGIAVLLTVVGIAGSVVALPVAVAFAAAAALMYDQLSGRMAARVYRRVERRARANGGHGRGKRRQRRRNAVGNRGSSAGFGAGAREQWDPPRDGRTARETAAGGRRASASRRTRSGPSPADLAAYDRLGVEPEADEQALRTAYRERVKEVHPDAPDGSREQFKAVQDAYEQVTD